MRREYRIGVIGRTGRGDYGHGLDTVWGHVEGCRVVAVADEDEKGRAEAGQKLGVSELYADYREMLDRAKPDIVAIGPRWIDEHSAMALAAVERGIHIYMEKPFCRTPAEADAIVRACEMTHTRLALAHQTRYSPRLAKVRELIGAGAIGRVLEIRGRGKEDARGGGEDLWVLGSHVLNLMNVLGGGPSACRASITVDGRRVETNDIVEGNEGLGPLAGDTVHASFELAGGVVGTFDSVRGGAGSPSRFGVVIYGSAGIIEMGTGYLPTAKILEDSSWSPGRSGKSWRDISSAGIDAPEPIVDEGGHGGNVSAVKDLILAIEENREPNCSPIEGRTTIEMIHAIFRSHVTDRTIRWPMGMRTHAFTDWKTNSKGSH